MQHFGLQLSARILSIILYTERKMEGKNHLIRSRNEPISLLSSHSAAFQHISFVHLVILIYPWAVARSLFSIPNKHETECAYGCCVHDTRHFFLICSSLLSARVPVWLRTIYNSQKWLKSWLCLARHRCALSEIREFSHVQFRPQTVFV